MLTDDGSNAAASLISLQNHYLARANGFAMVAFVQPSNKQ
jgi:hypothetical protein